MTEPTSLSWAQRIERARKNNRHFTVEDRQLARKYNTCAIGEKLGLTRDALPMEDEFDWLKFLGSAFERSVDNDDPDSAYARLCEIARESRRFQAWVHTNPRDKP